MARALPGFVGHTEWLEARCGVRRSVMMLAGERLKIALVTNHVAFAAARPRAITPARIVETLEITHRALRDDLGLARPRLALAALNPHAGDEGTFGDEEERLLRPALERARAGRGPRPAARSRPTRSSSGRRSASSTRWSRSTTTRASSR